MAAAPAATPAVAPAGGTGGGTGGAGYDGIYIGTVDIQATDGMISDSCTATWTGSAAAGCSVVTDGSCVEVVAGSVINTMLICEMTGDLGGFGPTQTTFSGSVDSSTGQVTGNLNGEATPVMGNVTGNVMRASFSWTKDTLTFNGSFEATR